MAPVQLPLSLGRFIGRRAEIEELKRRMADTRLMTLTGPGGCGKTRLALELAAEIRPGYADGVAFVQLSSVREPAAIRELVTSSLGLPREAADRLAELVGDARMLLVIDNVEHLLDGTSTLVQELLTGCPNLSVLTTSRELLDVAGEVSWRVPPLQLPPPLGEGAAVDVATIAGCDSVELFAIRAAENDPGFRLTAQNAPLVAAICRRLDGIPLALELAAARVRSMALTEIVARLDDSFNLLDSGSRAAVPRHRRLQATFDWSYSLLDERERGLFRRLSVFVATCDLAAVEAVCSHPGLPTAEIAHVMHRLVDKSLVLPYPQRDGGMRYGLIEVSRQYAHQRLVREEPADVSVLDARHARYYAGVVERLHAARDDDRERARQLAVEYDNVRLALEWAAREDPAQQAVMTAHLVWFWSVRGSLREARRRILSAVQAEAAPTGLRAELSQALAAYSRQAGELDAAAAQIEEASRLAAEVDDSVLACRVLVQRGAIRAERDDLHGAEEDFRGGLRLVQDLPPTRERGGALNNLAILRLMAGDAEEALRHIEDADETFRVMAARIPESAHAQLLDTYGLVLLALHRVDDARDRFLRGLELVARNGNDSDALPLLQGLACVSAEMGDAAGCLELLSAAHRCALTSGSSFKWAGSAAYERAERESRQALGPQRGAEAWARGQVMDVPAALERGRRVVRVPPGEELTPRKAEIIRLVAQGLGNKEIGRRLSISERTVEAHLEQIRNRFGFHNRAQITAWAVARGLGPWATEGRETSIG
jgi:non-specific serine/threonine protein kinase